MRKLLFLFSLLSLGFCEDVCYKNECQNVKQDVAVRFLLYDVNPPEGFNLRRDVYLRMAILAYRLKHSKNSNLKNFKLVLPPWSHLYHWSYSEKPEYIPWSKFFDINSLKKFAPVMDLFEYFAYLKKHNYTKLILDTVYILQHFEDMFKSGKFEDKWNVEKCQKPVKLRYFYYNNITSHNIKCLSFHGPATQIKELLKVTKARTILLEHAEVVLHDMFGSKLYWQARRSMRFNTKLRETANIFRHLYLNSTDEADNIYLEPDWEKDQPKRNAKGGPYVSVHLRRRDFLRGRKDEIPDLKSAAKQISKILDKLHLNKVFVATDGTKEEYEELKSELVPKYEVYRYQAPRHIEEEYGSGGIAIIDQIICSYARYFIGTSESTFSFRIQEEREILGFPTATTFNAFCKNESSCKNPSIWKIVY